MIIAFDPLSKPFDRGQSQQFVTVGIIAISQKSPHNVNEQVSLLLLLIECEFFVNLTTFCHRLD
jgi:hypothetical protein